MNSNFNVEELRTALSGDTTQLEECLDKIRPADCVSVLRELSEEEQIKVLTTISPHLAGKILYEWLMMASAEEFYLLEDFPLDFLTKIIDEMPSDNAVDLLNVLEKPVVSEILNLLPPETAVTLEEMQRYDEESAGGLMTDDFVSLPETVTVLEAIAHIKKINTSSGDDVLQTYRYIYVTDVDGRVVGEIPIVDLLIHPDSTPLKDVMNPDPVCVTADVDQEEVANMFRKYDLLGMPVINRARNIIGRITVDDVIDVINEEADEDIYKLVGSDDIEKETPSAIKIASIRLPWLLSTLFGSFLSSTVIKVFSAHVAQFVAIFFFMPLITAMSGNIGVQCSTLMVRGLATGFISTDDMFQIFFKEFRIGSIIALVCSLVAGAGAYIFIEQDIMIGVTVGISMLACILFASISGTAVPLILKKMGFDPAISSGPIITTFNDITGLLIYFSISFIFIL